MNDEQRLDVDLEPRLREALTSIEPAGEVDPGAARYRVRSRRRAGLLAGALAAIVAVVAGVAVLPTWWTGSAPVAAPSDAAGSPTPVQRSDGWRTEWYRDISFRVPASWGYETQPGSDWCVGDPEQRPRYDHPYVSLGRPGIVMDILCHPPNATLEVQGEHVAVFTPGPAEDYAAGTVGEGDWWSSVAFAGSVVIVAVSKDRDLAERITGSAQVAADPPCPATSRVSGFPVVTPPVASGVPIAGVASAVICQYDPDDDAGSTPGGLRGVRQLDAGAAERLLATFREAPLNESVCRPAPVDRSAQIAVTVSFATSAGTREVWVNAAGCPDGSGSVGGILDGRAVHTLTAEACRAILVEPIRIFSAGGDVGRNCLG